MGEVSSELCGGTHVRAAGDIGFFKIVSEAGIAAGVRRIEALTGSGAAAYVQQLEDEQKHLSILVKAEGGSIADKVERLLGRQKDLQRELDALQSRLNATKSADLLANVQETNGIKILAAKVETDDPKGLRDLADSLKDRLQSGVIVLGCVTGDKASLLVAVTKDLTGRCKAGDIIKSLAPIIGGSGGGKPELAQAGGTKPENMDEALEAAYKIIG